MPKAHMLNEQTHKPAGQPDDAQPVRLADDQFQTLVDLLTPGYQLSSMMLAEWQAHHAPKPAETDDHSGDASADITAKVAADNEAATDVAKAQAQVPDPIPTDPPAPTPEPIPDPIPPAPQPEPAPATGTSVS